MLSKTYCVELLKDVLVLDGRLALVDMTCTSNADTPRLVEASYWFDAAERALLPRLADRNDPVSSEGRAVILEACERLVEYLRRGPP